MTLTIPDNIIQQARVSEREILLELAVALFEQEKLTLGSAAALASLSQMEFQMILGERDIGPHYGLEELEQDMRTIDKLHTVGL